MVQRRRTTAVAVVGGAEDGDDIAVVGPVVALHHQLMRPRNKRQPVAVVESLGDVLLLGRVKERVRRNVC